MAQDKFVIEVRGQEENKVNAKNNESQQYEEMRSDSSLTATSASSDVKMTSFLAKSALIGMAVKTAKVLAIETPLKILSRVGEYTGNDQAQMQITNTLNQINGTTSFLGGLITNPLGTLIDAGLRMKDYELQIQKQNDQAEYLRKTLLVESSKGGQKY